MTIYQLSLCRYQLKIIYKLNMKYVFSYNYQGYLIKHIDYSSLRYKIPIGITISTNIETSNILKKIDNKD